MINRAKRIDNTFTCQTFIRLTFLILFLCVLVFPIRLLAASLTDKEGELEDLKAELQAEEEKYLDANAKEKKLSEEIRENQALLHTAGEKVKEAAELLENTTKELKAMKDELADKEKVYEEHQAELGLRLQNIYENLDPSCLGVLTEAKSFSEFINGLYYLQMLVEDDFRLLTGLQEEKTYIAEKKVAVENRYNEVLELKKELNEKEAGLADIVSEKQYLLALVHSERENCSDRILQLEHHTQEVEDQIYSIVNGSPASVSSPSYPSYMATGTLSCWPASGPVTSSFGWRCHPIYGDWRFHSGIDVGAYYGDPIVSAGDGVVITSDWLGGYGYTVMVDHGGGMVTLYGHCSSLAVSYGEHVSAGQTIAYVGSTGASTGPHLHFELRQSGVAVDPSAYY